MKKNLVKAALTLPFLFLSCSETVETESTEGAIGKSADSAEKNPSFEKIHVNERPLFLMEAFQETGDSLYLDSLIHYYTNDALLEQNPMNLLYVGLLVEKRTGYQAAETYYLKAKEVNAQQELIPSEERKELEKWMSAQELKEVESSARSGLKLRDALCDLALKEESRAQVTLRELKKSENLSLFAEVKTRKDLFDVFFPEMDE